MNITEPGSNFTGASNPGSILPDLTTTASIFPPPSYSSDSYDPEFTIMVVLGLSLLLAGLAAFLAVCRPSRRDGGSEVSCGTGEGWTRGGSRSGEPELKVWKRLGSYRRAYNLSFRRPPHRRPHEHESEGEGEGEGTHAAQSPAQQTTQPQTSVEPHLTVPCLFDYVTEI